MDKRRLEEKASGLIDLARNGRTVEDSAVELKAKWPDGPYEAARQLAGHANAARGAPILWLIGVDEKQRKVLHTEHKELASWYAALEGQFENRFCPALLLNIAVPCNDGHVIALYFETERAPYVVKNQLFGTQNGGPIKYEVPWREGNSTRSANRADLLKMLTKAIKLPSIEVQKASMTFSKHADGLEKWVLVATLYVVPQDNNVVVFPAHLWSAEFLHVFTGETLRLDRLNVYSGETLNGSVTPERITCMRPMAFTMQAERSFPVLTTAFPDKIDARIRLGIAGGDSQRTAIDLRMSDQTMLHDFSITWTYVST